MYQYFKRQLKTLTCYGPSGIHPQGVLKVLHTHHRTKFHAAKHRLRTQNITSNFSEALLIVLEDGSQRVRNMSEFLIVF